MSFKRDRTEGQLSLPSDLGRAVLAGELLIRDPANVYEGNLPSAITDRVYGVVDEINGGAAGQELPLRLMRRGERKVRIQDNATLALYDLVMPSASDAGSGVTLAAGGRPFAIALEAIASGGTAQYATCAIFADSLQAAGGGQFEHVYGEIADVSTAGSSWVVSPVAGDIVAIYSVIDGALATADAGLSFELGGTAVTGGGITITQSGSAAGDVDSSTPTAARTVTAGQAIEMITDGASTNTVKAKITFVVALT